MPRVYQPNELERLGSIISRALEASGDERFYRPASRPIRQVGLCVPGRASRGMVQRSGSDYDPRQMNFDFEQRVSSWTAITPENPVTDEDIPF